MVKHVGVHKTLVLGVIAAMAFVATAYAAVVTRLDVSTASTAASTTSNTNFTTTYARTVVTGGSIKQYGFRVSIPKTVNTPGESYVLGDAVDQCPATSITSISTGITPAATAFNPAGCPAQAKVGTATLGSQSGSLYLVARSPIPRLGVWFNSGVSPAYGRGFSWSYGADGELILLVAGLPNISTTGLKLTFNNPSRPAPWHPRIFAMIQGADPDCALAPSRPATATVYTYPISGTVANQTNVSDPVPVTGCL